MRILMDTSAYSNHIQNHPAIVEAVRKSERIYINPIAVGEIRYGFELGNRREENERRLRQFLRTPRVDVVAVDEETSVFYSAITASLKRAGTPIHSNDAWIAASAMQHGLQLLTSDAHFRLVTQVIVKCYP